MNESLPRLVLVLSTQSTAPVHGDLPFEHRHVLLKTGFQKFEIKAVVYHHSEILVTCDYRNTLNLLCWILGATPVSPDDHHRRLLFIDCDVILLGPGVRFIYTFVQLDVVGHRDDDVIAEPRNGVIIVKSER